MATFPRKCSLFRLDSLTCTKGYIYIYTYIAHLGPSYPFVSMISIRVTDISLRLEFSWTHNCPMLPDIKLAKFDGKASIRHQTDKLDTFRGATCTPPFIPMKMPETRLSRWVQLAGYFSTKFLRFPRLSKRHFQPSG